MGILGGACVLVVVFDVNARVSEGRLNVLDEEMIIIFQGFLQDGLVSNLAPEVYLLGFVVKGPEDDRGVVLYSGRLLDGLQH